MARRKQEIALQTDLESQEDWENALAKEGLLIIDVYQEWCGPCIAMISNLKRLKNELGDDLLNFATAKADTIDALELFRGRCEPCFLIYASGTLVYHLAGALSPALMKAIVEQLALEHKVLAGEIERVGIKDPMLDVQPEKGQLDEDVEEEEEEEEEEEIEKEVTLCLIKPDAVQAGKVDEIISQLTNNGFEVLEHVERHLTEDEAREFYSAQQNEAYFDDLVTFMCSGPSQVLVLSKGKTGKNSIAEFKDLIGPKVFEEAKENAPSSIRALFGTNSVSNAVHAADSKNSAMKELAFFFPGYVVPKVTTKKQKIQRTLALIRPDALEKHKDEILAKIMEAGFTIAFQKQIQLSKEEAEEFYKEHRGQEYFETLTTNMSSGPLLALALARDDAVTGWREMLGPKEVPIAKQMAPDSLRAQFSVEEDVINPLHGSDSVGHAEEELKYFFPIEQTVALVKPDAYQTKEEIIARIHEAGFRIAARKDTSLTKEVAEQIYADHVDKPYYNELTDHMCSGQSLFLVLSREDAVEGWRSMIGPPDPEVAKHDAPTSLRAEFGSDIKKNAVHGSSNPEHAHQSIRLIFGDVEFNPDGTIKGQEPDLDHAVVERSESKTGSAGPPTDEMEVKQEKDDAPRADGEENREEQGDLETSDQPDDATETMATESANEQAEPGVTASATSVVTERGAASPPAPAPEMAETSEPTNNEGEIVAKNDSGTLVKGSASAESPKNTESAAPAVSPTRSQSNAPAVSPARSQSNAPAVSPAHSESAAPAVSPARSQSNAPAGSPAHSESAAPAVSPARSESAAPVVSPAHSQSNAPALSPTHSESAAPAASPAHSQSNAPAVSPAHSESAAPAASPARSQSNAPAVSPAQSESNAPAVSPAHSESAVPAVSPAHSQSNAPAVSPAHSQSAARAVSPAHSQSNAPAVSPAHSESAVPAVSPAHSESAAPVAESSAPEGDADPTESNPEPAET